jgi:hypothetical protein
VDAPHQHPAAAPCLPACPAWAEGALHFFALQRRYPEMLEACRSAQAIEYVIVAPAAPGTVLPDNLQQEELVRLNLVVGRDTPEVLLDEWGLRCTLTFRGRRFDCAFPWAAVLAGGLRQPERKRLRFSVIEGAAPPASADPASAERPPAPDRGRLGVIKGGKG